MNGIQRVVGESMDGDLDEGGQVDGLISTGQLTPYGAYTPGLLTS